MVRIPRAKKATIPWDRCLAARRRVEYQLLLGVHGCGTHVNGFCSGRSDAGRVVGGGRCVLRILRFSCRSPP